MIGIPIVKIVKSKRLKTVKKYLTVYDVQIQLEPKYRF